MTRRELEVRVGNWLIDLGDWLRAEVLCVECSSVEDAGRHEPLDECRMCRDAPEFAFEHHIFVAPPGKLRSALTRAARR